MPGVIQGNPELPSGSVVADSLNATDPRNGPASGRLGQSGMLVEIRQVREKRKHRVVGDRILDCVLFQANRRAFGDKRILQVVGVDEEREELSLRGMNAGG